VGLRPLDAAQFVDETGFVSLWRHCSLLKNYRAVMPAHWVGDHVLAEITSSHRRRLFRRGRCAGARDKLIFLFLVLS
jgi:hypothetical protein